MQYTPVKASQSVLSTAGGRDVYGGRATVNNPVLCIEADAQMYVFAEFVDSNRSAQSAAGTRDGMGSLGMECRHVWQFLALC